MNDFDDKDRFSEGVDIRSHWKVVGETESRTLAEFAMNGLKSYEIPAVIDARPGVLGSAGLVMRSLSTGKPELFRILVPPEYEEEASEIIKIFLGGNEDSSHDELEDPDLPEGEG